MPFDNEEIKNENETAIEEKDVREVGEELDEEIAEGVDEEQELDLSAENERLCAELSDKEDRLKRLAADFENFRRRTAKEKEEISAVVTQMLLKDMLPLIDNFERALTAQKDSEAFFSGVEMIFRQLENTLKEHGLEYIETENKKFDPNFHQAIMRVEDPEKEDDTIVKELQKGYSVKGKVIRPSMVQVVAN